jgi:phage protein D
VAIAKSKAPLVSGFELVINGKAMPATIHPYVAQINVHVDQNLPSMLSFVMAGVPSQKSETVWVDDTALFAVGNEVEVKLGYGGVAATLLTAEVTGLDAEFTSAGSPTLSVRGYDRRHRLQRASRTRTFVQQKDSEIASYIAREAGLNDSITDSKVVHPYILQANQTDLAFLQERAKTLQYEIVVEGRTLHFHPAANAESELLTLKKNEDLLEFYPSLTSAVQVSEVMVQGWDPKEKKKYVGRAGGGDETGRMGGQTSQSTVVSKAFGSLSKMISDHPVHSQEEADVLAKSRFNAMALELISAEGVSWGRNDLKPGKVIKIDGVGSRFSGLYYVTSVSHRYSPSQGFYTNFRCNRNAT